jgi:hypothetical protein
MKHRPLATRRLSHTATVIIGDLARPDGSRAGHITEASVGNIGEHPHEVHHHHIPTARHDDPDVVVAERWILAATIMASSMAFIDGTVANVALPSIQSDLGATLAEAQWVVQVYALLLATLILVGSAPWATSCACSG